MSPNGKMGFALGYGVTLLVAFIAFEIHRRLNEEKRRQVGERGPYRPGPPRAGRKNSSEVPPFWSLVLRLDYSRLGQRWNM